MFANPYAIAIKYGLLALGILAIISAIFYAGMRLKQQEWDAALTTQAIRSAETIVEQAENTAKVEVRYIKVKGDAEIRTEIVEKEVIRYVESPTVKCVLTPEFVRTFDRISGLLDRTPIGVPAVDPPSGDADVDRAPVLTCVEVLRAYEHAIGKLLDVWNAYEALVDWNRSSHDVANGYGL